MHTYSPWCAGYLEFTTSRVDTTRPRTRSTWLLLSEVTLKSVIEREAAKGSDVILLLNVQERVGTGTPVVVQVMLTTVPPSTTINSFTSSPPLLTVVLGPTKTVHNKLDTRP